MNLLVGQHSVLRVQKDHPELFLAGLSQEAHVTEHVVRLLVLREFTMSCGSGSASEFEEGQCPGRLVPFEAGQLLHVRGRHRSELTEAVGAEPLACELALVLDIVRRSGPNDRNEVRRPERRDAEPRESDERSVVGFSDQNSSKARGGTRACSRKS